MAPFRLTRGVPRRSRVLLIVFVLVCLLLLLPSHGDRLGGALLFALFSPSSASGGRPAGPDILRFVDPLIGTVNGGTSRRSASSGQPGSLWHGP